MTLREPAGAGREPSLATRLADVTRLVPVEAMHAVGGVVPSVVAAPSDAAELAAAVAATAAAGAALVPVGRGAHLGIGHAPVRYDCALATTGLARTLDYTPADMTVTVEAGVALDVLARTLAAEGQWLPVDPPLPGATTIGGLVAADLAGPLRASQGRVRDFLIGVRMVTAEGRAARAGGAVVKNVAGYDLMKLATGSLGTLVVITAATFKVRPRPAVRRVLVLACPDRPRARALAEEIAAEDETLLAATLVAPLAGGTPPHLVARLGGVPADVAALRARLLARAIRTGASPAVDADEEGVDAAAAIDTVRDFARRAPGALVVRIAVLPRDAGPVLEAIVAALPGLTGSALVDPRSGTVTLACDAVDPAPTLATLAAVAARHGGWSIVERWPTTLAATIQAWSPLPEALPLMRRVKAALDPAGVLAPGRFVGRL